jgi:hypothetical protein
MDYFADVRSLSVVPLAFEAIKKAMKNLLLNALEMDVQIREEFC